MRQRSASRRRRVAGIIAVVMVVPAIAIGLTYRRQTFAYLTHWKGSPSSTKPYEPYAEIPLFHLAAAGDIGESGARLDATAAAIATSGKMAPYDVLLLLGDNVYPAGDPQRLEGTVFRPFRAALEGGGDLLAILGNHDIKQGNAPGQLVALGMEGPYWSRRYGDVLLIGLDSNNPDDPQQLDWLDRTLRSTSAPWRIVALHHPPYSAGYQGSEHDVRDAFTPLFERYHVQLVLSGHDHDYQRSKPINGVTYVVSGAASTTRRTGSAGFTAVSFSWHHFTDVAVFSDYLELRAVNQDLDVADDAVIPLTGTA